MLPVARTVEAFVFSLQGTRNLCLAYVQNRKLREPTKELKVLPGNLADVKTLLPGQRCRSDKYGHAGDGR